MTLSRFVRPILLTTMLIVAGWIVARSPLPTVSAQSQVVGTGPYRAGVVFRFADGQVQTRCVAFQEQEIGGDELLRRSGINDVILSSEGAVCSINGKGCPSDNCFCQCPFPNCEYWAYYHRLNGAWSYSQEGAMYAIIRDGSLDGWSWGQGDFQTGIEPPQMNFEDVCPATSGDSTATPTATPTATATSQASGSTAPPQVSFFAASPTLTPGQCTTLSWQTTSAASVMLENTTVALQGSQQVCPTASQSYTLVAANAAGQTTTRQVSVTVQSMSPEGSTPAAPPSATPTSRPVESPASRPAVTASVRTPLPYVTHGPQPLPGATDASAFLPPTAELGGGGVPLAPTAEPLPVMSPKPEPTATPFEFRLPPTETPRPRRVLSADGPTPTPMLVARADARTSGGSAAASPASGSAARAQYSGSQGVQSRSFTPDLLPGYAAYVASVAVLLIVSAYVFRRRRAPVHMVKGE